LEHVAGTGTVFELVKVHQTKDAVFDELTPYFVAAVELDEQPRLIVVANIVDAVEDPRIGDHVHVVFRESVEGRVLPQFVKGE
jgi:uncharacterized OB-fold protein